MTTYKEILLDRTKQSGLYQDIQTIIKKSYEFDRVATLQLITLISSVQKVADGSFSSDMLTTQIKSQTGLGGMDPLNAKFTNKKIFYSRNKSASPKHDGIDILIGTGNPVYSVGQGKVVQVSHTKAPVASATAPADDKALSGYGLCVVVEHTKNQLYTLYAHLSTLNVRVGDTVTHGYILGLSGSTGHSTGPHLHFEVRVGSNSKANTVDPLPYLTSNYNHRG